MGMQYICLPPLKRGSEVRNPLASVPPLRASAVAKGFPPRVLMRKVAAVYTAMTQPLLIPPKCCSPRSGVPQGM